MTARRRKGIAIVETNKGILVVSGKNRRFILPGGGAGRWESRKRAAIRELYEETGLRAKKVKYLFRHLGGEWRTHRGKLVRNHSKVFLIEAQGVARPRSEIKYINYWKSGNKVKTALGTLNIINRYLKTK